MMRSLFSGVSGLKNHQTRMDVIGNNISNVNTTGFKSSRVNFTDMLSQTLTGASSPQENIGGTNPKQIGLGSAVGAIDLIFTNGSVQSTGKNTDLCISGNALFQVKRGDETFYTRNGAFEFDAEGNYVLPGSGLFVQGWMANGDDPPETTGGTTNIIVKAGKSMKAKQSETSTYVNNLNGGLEGHEISAVKVTFADGTTKTVQNYNPQIGSFTVTIGGVDYDVDPDIAKTFVVPSNVTDQPIWSKTIKSVTEGTVSSLSLSRFDKDGSPLYVGIGPEPLTLTSGITIPADGLSVDGDYIIEDTITQIDADNKTKQIKLSFDGSKGINYVIIPMPEDSIPYKVGDTFKTTLRIDSITAAAGAKVKVEGQDDEEVIGTGGQTIDSTTTQYTKKVSGNVTAVERNADGVVYDDEGTLKKVKSVAVSTKDGLSVDGLTSVKYAVDEMYYPSVVTTVSVYDSEGGSHDVPVLFTKSDANTWKLSLSGGGNSYIIDESDGSTTEVTLESTNLTFNTNGAYTGGDGKLSLKYTNGAADQTVDLNLSGLTQYIGSSTINAATDGYAMGTLSSVSIDTSGVITGTYTNGQKRAEAQVAVAQFSNMSGLTKVGDSLYKDSNNSGPANVKTAADLGVTITPSALEMSNVDVANEFTDMIITQRGFQSNSKVITVSDEMLETLINMKR